MAATKPESGKTALAALTSAALCLPGVRAKADIPLPYNDIMGNVSYGHYQESSHRMQVDVYHADMSAPLTEDVEISFSMDRDTYGGATPAYSIPATMANQLKSGGVTADIVSAASPIASAAMLTTMGLSPQFKVFQIANSADQAIADAKIAALEAPLNDQYQASIQAGINALNSLQLSSVDINSSNYTPITVSLTNLLGNTSTSSTLSAQLATDQSTIGNYYLNLTQLLQTKEQQYTSSNPVIQGYLTQQASVQATLNQENSAYSTWLNETLPVDSQTVDDAINNPSPGYFQGPGNGTSFTVGFQNAAYAYSAFSGYANDAPQSNGKCAGTGSNGCYYEDGMVFSAVSDPLDSGTHIHHVSAQSLDASTYAILYHSDSDGIYMRAQDGGAFSLNSMLFSAPISSANQIYGANPTTDSNGIIQPDGTNVLGPNEYWQIYGFDTAVNPNLATTAANATTGLPNEVAYQTVTNGFNGILTLNSGFQDVNAVWIHYFGYPTSPTNGINFQVAIDNVNISSAYTAVTNSAAFQSTNQDYQNQIANLTATLNQIQTAIANSNASLSAIQNAITTLQAGEASAMSALNSAYASQQIALSQANATYQNALNSPDLTAQINAITREAGIAAYAQVLDSLVPTGTPTVQHFQTMPMETRSQPMFNINYRMKNGTVGISGGYSDEPDFLSNFGSINFSHEFNDKLTTISGAYSLSSNSIGRNISMMNMAGMNDPTYGPTNYPTLNGHSTYNAFTLSLAQVLDKDTLFQTSINYTNQSGYLSNPYKDVYIRGIITPDEYYQMVTDNAGTDWSAITNLQVIGVELFRENRPASRNIWSFSNQLNHFVPEFDGTLHADYRFYVDDWGVDSHTFMLKWYQELPWEITVTPDIRYYSQSQTFFFAPYYLSPRADGFYSSDYRLSAFGELAGGVTISKRFAKGIRLDASVEYVTHAGGLKLGGGGVGSYADFDYYMAHANLNVDLSAKSFDSDSGHHHHHHHGAPLPAGIMFGHMMNQPGDMMVGYRYMYSGQRGDMLSGSTPASDQTLMMNGCSGRPCLYKPLAMNMQMHMLNLMYAPTDWLNLMAMPQLMSMDMTMSEPIAGQQDDPNMPMGGMKMTSNNMGDTILMALVKVWEDNGHHMHLGLGGSAPTGSVDQVISMMDVAYSQDFMMQTGSGTWDLRPNLTYTGQQNDWGWGAQFSGVKRLGKNKYGYTFGDVFQATSWGSYRIFDWLSASLRGIYTSEGSIQGISNQPQMTSAPGDYGSNYGGRFFDIGFGLNASFHEGQFTNHSLGFEWLQPVSTHFNGYQLNRYGSLAVNWHYAF